MIGLLIMPLFFYLATCVHASLRASGPSCASRAAPLILKGAYLHGKKFPEALYF